MSENIPATDRRSFLKTGALVAAPLAAIAPVAALADDGSRAKLARLEDERAIEALHRDFLRRLNGKGAEACGDFGLDEALSSLADDPAGEPRVAFSDDSRRASNLAPFVRYNGGVIKHFNRWFEAGAAAWLPCLKFAGVYHDRRHRFYRDVQCSFAPGYYRYCSGDRFIVFSPEGNIVDP